MCVTETDKKVFAYIFPTEISYSYKLDFVITRVSIDLNLIFLFSFDLEFEKQILNYKRKMELYSYYTCDEIMGNKIS